MSSKFKTHILSLSFVPQYRLIFRPWGKQRIGVYYLNLFFKHLFNPTKDLKINELITEFVFQDCVLLLFKCNVISVIREVNFLNRPA